MEQDILLHSIVPDRLVGCSNYREWSFRMKAYLVSQGLWDNAIMQQGSYHGDWNIKNAKALEAIRTTCEPNILAQITNDDSAEITNDDSVQITNGDSAQITNDDSAEITNDDSVQITNDDSAGITNGVSAQSVWNKLAGSYGPLSSTEDHHTENVNYDNLGYLLELASKGDHSSMRGFLNANPDAVNARIPSSGETLLHVVVQAGAVQVVETLVGSMTQEALEITDNSGHTAFHYAAARGIVPIASCMIRNNDRLLRIPTTDDNHRLPITKASQFNRREMSDHLLKLTPPGLLSDGDGFFGSEFLEHCITSHLLDIALKALDVDPRLAAAKYHRSYYCSGHNALLWSLSMTPGIFPSSVRHLVFWKRWIYSSIRIPLVTGNGDQHPSQQQSILHGLVGKFYKFLANKNSGINKIYELKMTHAYSSELLHRACDYVSNLDDSKCQENGIEEALLNAVKSGIDEIVIKVVEKKPRLLRVKYDQEHKRDLLMLSIVYRQEEIFSSCCYGSMQDYNSGSWTVMSDNSWNTLLHLAGMLSPHSVLTRIPGAALQMQRELQWYQAVESVVNPPTKFKLNENDKTPEQLFSESHMQLVKDGEKWMKDTATSYTVVAALIITATFAAAFTVPGGNFQDIGIPVFLHRKAFLTFILADAISLFSASTSVLMFLGILTSRFAQQDFLKSLPTKLIIGIFMLFVSITAMMVAFSAALIVTLRGRLEVIITIVVLACVPVIVFLSLQCRLLAEMVKSTYGPGILVKNKLYWPSFVFSSGKR